MENKQPLLSICIPTYNRGYILKVVLEKYIQNPEFDDDVEIIISDNCSNDNTEEVCLHYSSLRKNIHYYRNSENIRDRNFIKVLDYANGAYLKLLNDWVYYDEDSLSFVKRTLLSNLEKKRPVFFTDNAVFTKKKANIIACDNLDEYVSSISTFVTYNNLFGVWKESWQRIQEKNKYSKLQLQQVDWAYQVVSMSGGCIIYDKKVLTTSPVKISVRSGYNWFKVHLDNYYHIMMPYVENGEISTQTYKQDKRYLLEHFKREFCLVYFYNYDKRWRFETEGTTKLLVKYYKNDPYIIYYIFKLPFFYIFSITKSICFRLKNRIASSCNN